MQCFKTDQISKKTFLLRGLVRRYMLCLSVVRLDDLSLVVVAVVVIVVIVVVAVVVPNWTFFLSLMRCRLSRVTQNKRHSVPLRRFFRLNYLLMCAIKIH